MSTHSYSRIWIHLIWETLAREPMLDKRAAAKASVHLSDYAVEKGIYMKINYFNADHTMPYLICRRASRSNKSSSFSRAIPHIGSMRTS